MSILMVIVTFLTVVCLAALAFIGVSFFGYWAWEVLEEFRENNNHHSVQF